MFSPDINYAEIAWRQHRAEEILEEQARIVQAREFYEGQIDDNLLAELINNMIAEVDESNIPALLNIYKAVIDEIASRLTVIALTDAPSTRLRPNPEAKPVVWAEDWWSLTDMDELQTQLFTAALRDGQAFIILEPTERWGTVMQIPYLNLAYTDVEVEGDGQGCRAHYLSGNSYGPADYYTKRWIEEYKEGDEYKTRQRLTIYVPHKPASGQEGRIEKYILDNNELVPFSDEGDPSNPIPWQAPLPIIHFRSPFGIFGRTATGPQLLIDNAVAAFAGTTAMAASPPLMLVGAYPTDDGEAPAGDGSNVMTLGPNRYIYWPNEHPDDIEMKALELHRIRDAAHAIDKLIAWVALTTRTPSLIQKITTTPEAAETLKQRDTYPTSTAEQAQTAFGNSVSTMFNTIALLDPVFSTQHAQGDTSSQIHALWSSADIRGILIEAVNLNAPTDQQAPTPMPAAGGTPGTPYP